MNLAVGIVQLAVEDYRTALFNEMFGCKSLITAEMMEYWFRSEYGQVICLGQGEYIINKVKEDVKRGRFYRP